MSPPQRRRSIHCQISREGIVTLAIFICQSRDALIGRRQGNQWLGELHGRTGPLQNPLFLANVTMPWDLVMRALSHFWRVTRQDNVVAQALLEKAIAIDPGYGQASGVLSASHTFCAHKVGRTRRPWRRSPSIRKIAET
jgi:hypothetical protein